MRSLISAGFIVACPVVFCVSACRDAPPEPDTIQREQSQGGGGSGSNGDPKHGVWSLADATKDIPGAGSYLATIDTSNGTLTCKLYDDKAPVTVANFIGLARGTRPWLDPFSNKWVFKPAYDGTTFHRIIKGFMIQGGDAKGNGSGEAGYVIKDEVWSGAKHDRAGLICMANRGPNTNSAQFFITDAAAAHLDSGYTIFGECSPEATVHAIANVPVRGETPVSKVMINTITISRGAPPVIVPAVAVTVDAAVPSVGGSKPKDGGK